jgi:hypothetical protein
MHKQLSVVIGTPQEKTGSLLWGISEGQQESIDREPQSSLLRSISASLQQKESWGKGSREGQQGNGMNPSLDRA